MPKVTRTLVYEGEEEASVKDVLKRSLVQPGRPYFAAWGSITETSRIKKEKEEVKADE